MTKRDLIRELRAMTWEDPRYRARLRQTLQEGTMPPGLALYLLKVLLSEPAPDLPGGQTPQPGGSE